MILTGEPVGSEEALAAGLVDAVHEDAVEGAAALLDQVLANGPLAVRNALLAVDAGLSGLEDGLLTEASLFASLRRHRRHAGGHGRVPGEASGAVPWRLSRRTARAREPGRSPGVHVGIVVSERDAPSARLADAAESWLRGEGADVSRYPAPAAFEVAQLAGWLADSGRGGRDRRLRLHREGGDLPRPSPRRGGDLRTPGDRGPHPDPGGGTRCSPWIPCEQADARCRGRQGEPGRGRGARGRGTPPCPQAPRRAARPRPGAGLPVGVTWTPGPPASAVADANSPPRCSPRGTPTRARRPPPWPASATLTRASAAHLEFAETLANAAWERIEEIDRRLDETTKPFWKENMGRVGSGASFALRWPSCSPPARRPAWC